MTTAQLVEGTLPVIAALVMSCIQQDTWPTAVNALIAILVLVAEGTASALLGGQLTGHAATDIGLIITATMALQSVPSFQPLFDYLRANFFVIAPHPKTPLLPSQSSMSQPPQGK